MKRWALTAASAGLLVMALALPVMAAEWKRDQSGWWYAKEDGSYEANGWSWIDGKCYYFDENGYMLQDTVTPDGYTVNEDGAWVVDGVVQTQNEQSSGDQAASAEMGNNAADAEAGAADGAANAAMLEILDPVVIGNLTFAPPAGFKKAEELSSDTTYYFVNDSMDLLVGVVSEKFPDMAGYEGLLEEMEDLVLDEAMTAFGTVAAKTERTFTTGTWYQYRYTDTDALGIPGQFYSYARIENAELQMVVFAGNVVGMNMTDIMNENLR